MLALDDVALMDEELRAMVQSRALDSAFARPSPATHAVLAHLKAVARWLGTVFMIPPLTQ